MFKNKLNYRIINFAALMLLLYIGVTNIGIWWGILTKIVKVLAPFIVGLALAYALTPLVRFLDKKLPRGMAVIIVILGCVLVILGMIAITLPLLYDQLSLLIKIELTIVLYIPDT